MRFRASPPCPEHPEPRSGQAKGAVNIDGVTVVREVVARSVFQRQSRELNATVTWWLVVAVFRSVQDHVRPILTRFLGG